MWLFTGALIVATLAMAFWVDWRARGRPRSSHGPDEVRNRVAGNAVLGKDWRSPDWGDWPRG